MLLRVHAEGKQWAQSLINDCRYRIGTEYIEIGRCKLTKRWLLEHKQKRKRGLPSLYSMVEVKQELKKVSRMKT